MIPPEVKEYLLGSRRAFLERLFELLRIASIANVTPAPGRSDACRQAADWLMDYLSRLGFSGRVIPTAGKPAVLAGKGIAGDKPTLLIYGHYDVQPAEPLELWVSQPFEPEIRDGFIYARGASDDKGQLFAHLMAMEAWERAAGKLPVNVKILIEGEEEIGSPNLEPFIAAHGAELSADAAVISDSEFFAPDLPSITVGLRGVMAVEIVASGPARDLHSGAHGGAVANPANALAKIIAAMHDESGRVTIEDFYKDVLEIDESDRKAWQDLPFDEHAYADSLGVDSLGGGERHYSALHRRWCRPTLDCNGMISGYTGRGGKTIIPACASAKLSMRLVPDQQPGKILESFRRFVVERTPPGIQTSVEFQSASRPVLLTGDSPAMRAAQRAYEESFGRRAVLIRCGASVPVTEMIQRLIGLDAVLMGFGLPDDALHSPNERFSLDQLWKGAVCAAAFLGELPRQLRH